MSTGATPIYAYSDPGVFSVSETLFNVNGTATLTETDLVTVIPEPSTFLLVGMGLLAAVLSRRRQ
jgi:PKD repeat protein